MSDERFASTLTSVFSQLLRQQELARRLVQEVKDELDTPQTRALLDQLRGSTTGDVEEGVGRVLSTIEAALQAVKHCQTEIHRELLAPVGSPNPVGPSNLPPRLTRFLVERKDTPGFTHEVRQDPVRGWIIRWKEYSREGVVRGAGQFYERPYAWLNSVVTPGSLPE